MENKKKNTEVFATGRSQPKVILLSISNLIFCLGFLWHAQHCTATLKHNDLQDISLQSALKRNLIC